MYTVLSPPILHTITGLRFQPLVDFHSGQAVAYEVLVEIHNMDLDVLFASLPTHYAMQIFFWQANMLLQMPDKGQYWLNLPAAQLLDARAICRLLALRHQQRLTIEIQDPSILARMSAAEQRSIYKNLHQLKAAGWKIWLDDITLELVDDYARLALPVDGIKLDRAELNTNARFDAFVQFVREKIAKSVLVEGIETTQDLKRACASGAQFGQGFLWPESRIAASMTE
ncbi:EAL domain-containing protein [Kosakonia oryziphila]|uniref:EAL domain, c-di-GMP-specific phosphodiesterase class I (Or its enzymatically inactive variant) n=1 Tax=Kosakonia oryziphila TaxID=1005667 RepID=A0A1C4DRR5_9ENTR|nr:EAL domain-containing protein [Kosakonia oryziphila]SCC33991.1 EAL domain, c-di-GMP-specific phosphodiesterase class I (or its enzymatically inactive variant) [Kosakonia oryziphila]